jgi:hypothetical protein
MHAVDNIYQRMLLRSKGVCQTSRRVRDARSGLFKLRHNERLKGELSDVGLRAAVCRDPRKRLSPKVPFVLGVKASCPLKCKMKIKLLLCQNRIGGGRD